MSLHSAKLFFFLVLSGISACGQESLGTFHGVYATHYDPKSRIHTQVFRDSMRVIEMTSGRTTIRRVRGIGERTKDYQMLRNSEQLYLVNRAGGLVYQVSGDSLQRIDRSYQHLMQFNSLNFVYNDTIYRHGGYGFWSARREMIYFDPGVHEWEVVRPLKTNRAPHGLYQHIGILDQNKLIVMAGLFIDINDPFDFRTNQEVWSFDFRQKEWTKIGDLSAAAAQTAFDYYPGLQANNRLIFFSRDIKVYDFEQNRLRIFEASPFQSFLGTDSYIRPFYDEGQFYLYKHLNSRPNLSQTESTFELIRIQEAELFRKELESVPLIQKSTYELYILLASVSLLVGISLLFYFRKKPLPLTENPVLTTEGITYRNKTLPLTPPELEIIRVLLAAESEITTNQILEITQNPNQDYTHNLRMKNQLIEKLNVGLRTLLNLSEDIIISERSSVDRRIRTYSIRKEYFAANR